MTEQQEANYQKWIAALRSGTYVQIFNAYGSGCWRCALGVGFQVCESDMGVEAISLGPVTGISDFGAYAVMRLNDGKRLPFPAIADEIEAHKAEWFV